MSFLLVSTRTLTPSKRREPACLIVFDVPWFVWVLCVKLGYYLHPVDRLNSAVPRLDCCAAWAFAGRRPYFHRGTSLTVLDEEDQRFRLEARVGGGVYCTPDLSLQTLLDGRLYVKPVTCWTSGKRDAGFGQEARDFLAVNRVHLRQWLGSIRPEPDSDVVFYDIPE